MVLLPVMFVVFVLPVLSAVPQDNPVPEENFPFLKVAPYKPHSLKVECANMSAFEFEVALQEGELKIFERSSLLRTDDNELPFSFPWENGSEKKYGPERQSVPVNNGWIVSLNNGEFGGSIWWFSKNGEQYRKLGTGNVVGFVKTPEHLFAVQGLSHMSLSRGSILQFEQGQNGDWKQSEYINLGPLAPNAFMTDSTSTILILTTNLLQKQRMSLIRVHLNQKSIETLYERPMMGMYPNSMVKIDTGDIYVGMRHGVGHLSPKNGVYEEEWLVTDECVNPTAESNERMRY